MYRVSIDSKMKSEGQRRGEGRQEERGGERRGGERKS